MSRREHWLWKEEALANPGQRERTGTKVDKENSDSPLAVARGVLRKRDMARRLQSSSRMKSNWTRKGKKTATAMW